MRSFIKSLSLVFLLISIISCDVMSDLLTTNHFEQFKDTNPFSLIIDTSIDWNLDDPRAEEAIDDYTLSAFSEDSQELFDLFKGDTSYRDEVTTYYKTWMAANIPTISSDTYVQDMDKYQNRAMALALIEVYSRDVSALDGFDDLFMGYFSGEIEAGLTQETFISEVFNTANITEAELGEGLTGFYKAGEAINLLGSTIYDVDNPSSIAIDSGDGMLVLMSCMIYRIVELSTGTFDSILTELVNYIKFNIAVTNIVFPQDETPTGSETMLQLYLGVGGALAYTASGMELPSTSILGGV